MDGTAVFPGLRDAAGAGEEIIIAKDGKPFVRLGPVLKELRRPGAAKRKGALTPEFFDPLINISP